MNVHDDDTPVDPAEGLAIIEAQRALTRDRSEPDARLLFGVWGIAYLVGYLSLYWTARDSVGHRPAVWSFTVFGIVIASAVVITIVHVIVRTAGMQGVSARSGAMYGWSWTIGFIGIYLIINGLGRAGASSQVLDLAWNALPILLVGILYLAGGALWQTTVMFALGVWFCVLAGVVTVIGLPDSYLVLALAGGGGMLLGTLISQLIRRNRKPSGW